MAQRRCAQKFIGLLQTQAAAQAAGACQSTLSWLPALGIQGPRLRLAGQGQGGMLRTFASQPMPDARERFDRTNSLLQQVQVLKLRQDLDDESERNLHISHTQLLHMIKASGSAHDDKEAEEVSLALHRAGVVLRHHDIVYLKPEEIAEVVMQVLPGGKEDASVKLLKIEEELLELDRVHLEVDKQAHRLTTRLLTVGYIVLFTQLVSFIYLTWWELSWDVMEPIAYIISLFYSLLGYTYFMATKGGIFDLQPFKEFWHKHIKAKKVGQINFDEERYLYLQKMKDRYKRHLAHAALKR